MGSRLKRRIGYGLPDVKLNKQGEVIDERFKSFDPFQTLQSFQTFLDTKIGDIANEGQQSFIKARRSLTLVDPKQIKRDAYDYIALSSPDHVMRSGKNLGAFVVTPLLMNSSWRHYNDPFDYIDLNGKSSQVKVLSFQPYPYMGLVLNKISGVPAYNADFWNALNGGDTYFLKNGKADEYPFKGSPFTGLDDLLTNGTSGVPMEIFLFTEWLGCFSNNDVWKQMKPMLVSYYS